MALVYLHRRKDDLSPFYVGASITKNRPYIRSNRSKTWKEYVKSTPYFVEVLVTDIAIEDAYEIEMLLIQLYGRKDKKEGELLNMTDGGRGHLGSIRSVETRKKIGKASKGNSYGKGYKHTEEAKRKISKALKNRVVSEETRKKISENSKISSSSKWFKELISRTMSKPVNQYDLNGNFIKSYKSLTEAHKKTGALLSKISNVCNGKRKTTKGFIWKFKID